MTTLADVLAEHRWEAGGYMADGTWRDACQGCDWRGNNHEAHQVEAVAAAGLVVVQLPEPTDYIEWTPADGDEWAVWGRENRAYVAHRAETPMNVDETREFAAALLAAAAAAEAVTG